MSVEGGKRAIVAALLANTGIAITKFVAFLLTGSSSMLADSVHSLADSGNQGLLLIGGKRSRREATPLHPFGYGRERYVYASVVSIVLFTQGVNGPTSVHRVDIAIYHVVNFGHECTGSHPGRGQGQTRPTSATDEADTGRPDRRRPLRPRRAMVLGGVPPDIREHRSG